MLSYFFLTSQVASRGLCQTCGTELHVQFLSNAPIAVMKNYNNKSNQVSQALCKSKARKISTSAVVFAKRKLSDFVVFFEM